MIPFGESSLTRTVAEFTPHYHGERNHQGKGNKLLFPEATDEPEPHARTFACRQRLGGLVKYYDQAG